MNLKFQKNKDMHLHRLLITWLGSNWINLSSCYPLVMSDKPWWRMRLHKFSLRSQRTLKNLPFLVVRKQMPVVCGWSHRQLLTWSSWHFFFLFRVRIRLFGCDLMMFCSHVALWNVDASPIGLQSMGPLRWSPTERAWCTDSAASAVKRRPPMVDTSEKKHPI